MQSVYSGRRWATGCIGHASIGSGHSFERIPSRERRSSIEELCSLPLVCWYLYRVLEAKCLARGTNLKNEPSEMQWKYRSFSPTWHGDALPPVERWNYRLNCQMRLYVELPLKNSTLHRVCTRYGCSRKYYLTIRLGAWYLRVLTHTHGWTSPIGRQSVSPSVVSI